MAVVIRDILESHNIPYFITYGTLLGAVRHQGFIPWDDDFDFYLFDDSYDKAIHALRAEMPVNMFLEDEDYKTFLKDMRELLKHEKEFKDKYCEVNHIKSRQHKVCEEEGEADYVFTENLII